MLNCLKYFLIYTLRQNVPKNKAIKALNQGMSLCAKQFQIYFVIYIFWEKSVAERQTKKLYQVFTDDFLCQNDKMLINIIKIMNYVKSCV